MLEPIRQSDGMKPRVSAPTRPMPRSHRELLEAMHGYYVDLGLDAWLSTFDMSDVTAHHVYGAALDRLPESAAVARTPAGYSARQHLRDALLSAEYRNNLIARTLRAFPEKKRVLFVHIPKCAGSGLESQLTRRFPHVLQLDQHPMFTSSDVLLQHLSDMVTALRSNGSIAAIGHLGLDWLLSERLIRQGDEVFTVVRDPVEIAISQVNFVLTTALDPLRSRQPGIVPWLADMGIREDLPSMTMAQTREYAATLLKNEKVVPDNFLCRYLGQGDVSSAHDLCASADIEITTVSRYDRWLETRWGITLDTRVNESRKFLTRADLSPTELCELATANREDRLFYECVERTLQSTGRLSIRGAQLIP